MDRNSGVSTRLVDKYVQDLFTVGKAKVIDQLPAEFELDSDIHRKANIHLIGILTQRMQAEHRRVRLKVEQRTFTVHNLDFKKKPQPEQKKIAKGNGFI